MTEGLDGRWARRALSPGPGGAPPCVLGRTYGSGGHGHGLPGPRVPEGSPGRLRGRRLPQEAVSMRKKLTRHSLLVRPVRSLSAKRRGALARGPPETDRGRGDTQGRVE